MARFDVFRLVGGSIALDCQSDYIDHLDSQFTAPLLPLDAVPARITGLHPIFDIDGQRYVMATHLAGAIPANSLKIKIGSLAAQSYIVQRALDTLTGTY